MFYRYDFLRTLRRRYKKYYFTAQETSSRPYNRTLVQVDLHITEETRAIRDTNIHNYLYSSLFFLPSTHACTHTCIHTHTHTHARTHAHIRYRIKYH
jgi:hypothetical protein